MPKVLLGYAQVALLAICSISSSQFQTLAFTSTTTTKNTFFAHHQQQRVKQELYSKSKSKAPPGGINFEVDDDDNESVQSRGNTSSSSSSSSSLSSQADTTTSSTTQKPTALPFQNRGKVNEIDFCMSPSDVSLSRSYETSSTTTLQSSQSQSPNNLINSSAETGSSPIQQPRILSLTRALNSASNRAVRRILLSRCWPSAEALNVSLRQILASSKNNNINNNSQQEQETSKDGPLIGTSIDTLSEAESSSTTTAKCPVPRPILNIIVRQQANDSNAPITQPNISASSSTPSPLTNMKLTDEQWVEKQMTSFRETYGLLPGYEYADAYMECILSLATSGVESERVNEVIAGGVYDDSYRRLLSVLKSAGAVFEGEMSTSIDKDNTTSIRTPRMKIARKLLDQDISLSMLDKIAIRNEKNNPKVINTSSSDDDDDDEKDVKAKVDEATIVDDKEIVVKKESEIVSSTDKEETTTTESAVAKETNIEKSEVDSSSTASSTTKSANKKKSMTQRLLFFMRKPDDDENDIEDSVSSVIDKDDDDDDDDTKIEEIASSESISDESDTVNSNDDEESNAIEEAIKPEDLGAVLLSAEEPTMTRQLNVLSNIVKRALLFGGDQELLVLSETLEADKPAFIQRWYPDSNGMAISYDLKNETRLGVQFFNCLVQLLKDCYTYGVVTDLAPPLPLSPSYENSYERLTALSVELGSGYIKPVNTRDKLQSPPNGTPTPKEEFTRFYQWEVALRQRKSDITDYPSDLLGSWQVKDEIGGKVIGTSTVVFRSDGEVFVDPPLRGLRWRVDPGPTHLDTCTFQVLSEDGAILQYKGFMDRGARLESRFSKRSIKIRGAVTFQMRDGETALLGEDYKRDMLSINTQTGTTRFVMSKVFDLNNN